jgi:hypothetical protein
MLLLDCHWRIMAVASCKDAIGVDIRISAVISYIYSFPRVQHPAQSLGALFWKTPSKFKRAPLISGKVHSTFTFGIGSPLRENTQGRHVICHHRCVRWHLSFHLSSESQSHLSCPVFSSQHPQLESRLVEELSTRRV